MEEINKSEWSLPIRIKKTTKERLRKLGYIGKEWDIIINKLIDEYKKSNKN